MNKNFKRRFPTIQAGNVSNYQAQPATRVGYGISADRGKIPPLVIFKRKLHDELTFQKHWQWLEVLKQLERLD
jgi:hypothetical protein